MPCSSASSRKYSTWIRLPNSRPCMSVNAVTTVSIVPASASSRRASSVSRPRSPPGPPGRRSPSPSFLATSGVPGDFVFFERPHRALVLVLGRDQVPDAEDQRDDDRQRRVVDDGRIEVVVPRQAGRGEGDVE